MALLEHELEALELEGELEGELESELEGEGEFEALGELEFEAEGELESEISPIRKIYPDAMMEHIAHMAAEAETEQEAAEHFLPLIGLAASKLLPVVAKAAGPLIKKALPQIARAVTRVQPRLTRGITTIARGLHRNPATRPLLRAMPSIARRTVHSVATQAAKGRTVTPQTATRTLAQQTRRVLANRPQRARTLQRSRAMDRQLHHKVAPGVARPHGTVPYAGQPGGMPVPGGSYPGAPAYAGGATAGGWVTATPPRPGSVMRTGAVVCPPCPRCDGAAAAAPSYCRCCGQVLR